MQWLEVRIETNHAGLEPVENFLSGQGIDSLVIDDEQEFQEFLQENRQCWDYVDDDLLKREQGRSRISFYLEDSDEGASTLARVRTALSDFRKTHTGLGTLLMTLNGVADADWENSWKQYYHPLETGERLLIVPAWETVPESSRIPLILNPGLTFGTGSHATTRLCLTALEQQIHGGERVLDLGCGSGILSIAALRLGAAHAFACDLDEKCRSTVEENAGLNGIAPEQLTLVIGDILELLNTPSRRQELGGDCGCDIILANIVADVIIALAPQVRSLLRPGGVFLCSGIIDDRATEVEQVLRQNGWTVRDTRSSDGWYAFTCD